MRTIVGILLLVLSMVSIGLANVLHFKAEAELLEERPELGDKLYFGLGLRRHNLVGRFYKEVFPDGNLVRRSWWCAITGFLEFASGFVLLGFFK
jgi:hypothetical protein